MPAISFIMPMYNAQAFLAEALDSVLGQTLACIEVLCIDDGSSDDSVEIASAYAARDARVRVLRQDHRGVCAARNAGIEAARGEFLCFYDSDDFFYNDRFAELVYRAAVDNRQLVAGASLYNFRAPDKFETTFEHPFYHDYVFEKDEVIAYNDFQFDYGFTRHIYASELFAEGRHRFGSLSFFEDTTWMVRILHDAGSFVAVTGSAYVYRSDYRPILWSTQKVLDLIEGAQRNLDFSKEHGLAKLHWYTAHHFDEAAHYTGVGLLSSLDTEAIATRLLGMERHIDRGLLVQVDPADAGYQPLMHRNLFAALDMNPMARAVSARMFLAKRAITPWYHRLVR